MIFNNMSSCYSVIHKEVAYKQDSERQMGIDDRPRDGQTDEWTFTILEFLLQLLWLLTVTVFTVN